MTSKRRKAFVTVSLLVTISFLTFVLPAPPARAATYFSDGFDPPAPGWTTTGAWHVADDASDGCYGSANGNHPPAPASGTGAMAYHYDASPPAIAGDACTYNLDDGSGAPSRSAGNATTPAINLAGVPAPVWLHFSTWRQTEGNLAFDTMTVFVDYGSGPVSVLQVGDVPGGQTFWETLHADLSAAAGQPSVRVIFAFDTIDARTNHFAGWYVDDVLVDDLPPPPDTLTLTLTDVAPAVAYQGDFYVVMAHIDGTVNTGTVRMTSMRIDLTGSPPADADIFTSILWWDDGDGLFDYNLDLPVEVGAFAGGTLTFTPLLLDFVPGPSQRLFVTYRISTTAGVGNYVGLRVANAAYVTVNAPAAVVCANCPFDTYVPATKTRIEPESVDTLTWAPFVIAPAKVQPQTIHPMGGMNFTIDANWVTIFTVRLDLTGLPPSAADLEGATLWADGGDGLPTWEDDIFLAGAMFSGGSATFSLTIVMAAGSYTWWFVYGISAAATPGNWVGFAMDSSSVTVLPPDAVSCTACPVNSYVFGLRTEIIAPTADNVTIEPFDVAPRTAVPNEFPVVMGGLNITVDANTAIATALRVDLTGLPPSDMDAALTLWLDDYDGDFDGAETMLGFSMFSGGTATIPFPFPVLIEAGRTERIWIVFGVAMGATVGNWIGARVVDASYLSITAPDTATCTACPLNTYSPGVKTLIGSNAPDSVTFRSFSSAPNAVQPGDADVVMGGMDVSVGTNAAKLQSVRIDLTGAPPSDADVSRVRVWLDDGDASFDADDALLGSNAFSGWTTTVTLFPPVDVLAGAGERLWFTYDISPTARVRDYVGFGIAASSYLTVLAPDTATCIGCPFSSYTRGVRTEIVAPPPPVDTLMVTPGDRSPPWAFPGDTDVLIAHLFLSADANDVTMDRVVVDVTGTGGGPDVSSAGLWLDDGDGAFDPALDAPLGATPPVGDTFTFVLSPGLTVAVGAPETVWVSYDISASAGLGLMVGVGIADATYFGVVAPDLVACAGCPFTTYDGTRTVIESVDTVTFLPTDRAPSSVLRGTSDVLMAGLNLTVDDNTADILELRLERTGTVGDGDASVRVRLDDGDGFFDLADATVGTASFVGGMATVGLVPVPLAPGTPQVLWIAYDIAAGAPDGSYVGVRLANASSVYADPPDVTSCPTCPLDTYDGAKTRIDAMDQVVLLAGDLAPANATRGQPDVAMLQVDVSVGTNDATLDAVRVNLTGTGADADVARVSLFLDDGDLTFDPAADLRLDSGPFVGGSATLTAGQTVNPSSSVRIFVAYDIAPTATIGAILGASVDTGSFLVAPPDTPFCALCLDTYDGTKTEILAPANAPPEARGLTVEGFSAGTQGILHILAANPVFAWTYSDPEGDAPADYEVRVSSAAGASGDVWMPGAAGAPGSSVAYAGPALADGTDYWLAVRVHDGTSWSLRNETRFRTNGPPPQPAPPVTPADGDPSVAPGPGQAVTWTSGGPDPDGDPVTYEWQVATDPSFTMVVASGSGASNASTTFTTLPGTTYHWRARADDGWETSAWARFNFSTTGVNQPPVAQALTVGGHADASAGILHILAANPVFAWTFVDPESAAQAMFGVRVGSSPGASDRWAPGPQSGSQGSVTYGGVPLVDGLDYYFAVRVHDGVQWSAFAEVRFHTNTPPPTPAGPNPADQATVAPGARSVSWASGGADAEGDAVTYEWEVSTDPAFAVVIASGAGAGTSSTSFTALPGTTYHWRVRADDGWETSAWATFAFATSTPPTTGSVLVRVTSGGSALAGALVTLLDAAGNVVATATTGNDGAHNFTGLAFGSYSVHASAEGHQGATRSLAIDAADRHATVDLHLDPLPEEGFPWWILLLLAVLIAALLLFLLYRRRKREEEEESPPPEDGVPEGEVPTPAEGADGPTEPEAPEGTGP